MLSKSRQVFASAYKDIQRLIWNFHSENSTQKMLLRAKKKLTICSRKAVKLKKIWFKGRGLILGKVVIYFFDFALSFPNMSL